MSSDSPQKERLHDVLDEEPAGLPLREYWQVVRKHMWTILLVVCLVTGLGVVYAINQTDIFRASTTIEIRTESPRFLGGEVEPVVDPAAGARYWSTQEYYETQYRILRSRAVAERVVEVLQLAENLEFLGIDPTLPREQLQHAIEAADPVDRLIDLISVVPVPDSQLVEVQIAHPDPDLATLLANTVAEVFVERNVQRQMRGTDDAFHWLESERQTSRERLDEAEQALLEFRQSSGVTTVSLDDRQQQLTDSLRSVTGLLAEAQANVHSLRAEMRQIRHARETIELDDVALPAVIENPLIQALKERRQELIAERDRLDPHGELVRNERVQGISASLVGVEDAIRREIGIILESYESRLTAAEAREAELLDQQRTIRDEQASLSQAQPAYNQLVRDIENDAQILTMLERRYKETDLYRRQQDVNNIDILDAAVVPDRPVRPRRRVIVAVSVLLGFVLGLGLAFLLELLDNTVRTQEDVEQALGFTFLGVVPSIKETGRERRRSRTPDARRDLFIHHHPKSTAAECCRSIRTNLHFMSPDRPLRRLLITSAGPREGKTSTAINLATVMAQSNQRVVLVDTDMRRPRLHQAFGVGNQVGLTNLMLGEVDYDAAVRTTDVEGLSVLPCGPIPPNPTELMHTDRFTTVIDELSRRFDRVIFDSPPVIAVADAMILANVTDGVLFVIKTGQTSRHVVRRARDLLRGINAPVLGAVLNDLDLEDRAYRYHHYYSYYYRYGQYYEDVSSDRPNTTADEEAATS